MKTLKEHLSEHILKEKLSGASGQHYIQQLQLLHDSDNIAFAEFTKTGRFIPREEFEEAHPDIPLHKDCTDVVKYAGLFVIQALKNNKFRYEKTKNNIFESPELKDVERAMWEMTIKLLI